MKRMLVNATQPEELRVAMVDGQKLYDLDIEVPSREQKKSNIYKGKITRIEPSLEAAFVDYGAARHGFLPLKEISRTYFKKKADAGKRINIRDVLEEGQELVVQVEKEERGNKGAALTTFISLAGRFMVLMPNNPRAGGVSRRIEGADRNELRDALSSLTIPKGMGVIVRTAGVGRSEEELAWDLDYLISVWNAIESAVDSRKAPFLVYQESNAIIRALRDHLSNDTGEIVIDDESICNEAREFIERVMPHNARKLKHYTESTPLFTRFQIESQIESAFSHKVDLPSGGSIVIDATEALVSIDINSARATRGDDIETTAFNTNLEAADAIARQLRIRDMGGLIVIDFIDMNQSRNQREVENRLREAVKVDRARVQIGRISRFGLLEMSRQRLRPSLEESSNIVCPRCNGQGVIRDVESLALAILRLLGEEVRKDHTAKVIANVPVEVASFLLNEKRDWVNNLEQKNGTDIVITPDPRLQTPNYSIRRVRGDEANLPENSSASYQLIGDGTEEETESGSSRDRTPKPQQPAVSGIVPTGPAPTPVRKEATVEKAGLIATIKSWFSSSDEEKDSSANDKSKPQRSRQGGRQQQNRKRNERSGRRSSRGGRNRRRRGKSDKPKATANQASQKNTKRKPDNANQSGGDASKKESANNEDGKQGARTPRRRRGRRGSRNRNRQTQNRNGDTPNKPKEANDGGRQNTTSKNGNQPNNDSNKPSRSPAANQRGERSGKPDASAAQKKPDVNGGGETARKPKSETPAQASSGGERSRSERHSKPEAKPTSKTPETVKTDSGTASSKKTYTVWSSEGSAAPRSGPGRDD
ncbi:MAG: Rne/Rng family ribonuclease [Pseudomonadota bacterium]